MGYCRWSKKCRWPVYPGDDAYTPGRELIEEIERLRALAHEKADDATRFWDDCQRLRAELEARDKDISELKEKNIRASQFDFVTALKICRCCHNNLLVCPCAEFMAAGGGGK